jgi:ribulose-5-phosphate 4-epimerase/fuculose-1-phosphate aldolase
MKRAQALGALVRLSRRLGRDPLLVQAAGGNVSVKMENGAMLIKSSGARLRRLTRRDGWISANARAVRIGLSKLGAHKSPLRRELGYAALLGSAAPTSGPRVSM